MSGARGRIGRTVVDLAVAEGHTVVCIDRESDGPGFAASDFVRLDMRDYDSVREAVSGCDALIHLAAISGPGRDPDHVVHNNNVISSYNALRAAADVGITRVCQASSINAIGGRFSHFPRYDYFPVDEAHPAYPEDSYSLSKLICEQQASSIARRFDDLSIASLRIHGVVEGRAETQRWVDLPDQVVVKQLWGYVGREATARACLLGVTAGFDGHEVFYIVAPKTMVDIPSLELAAEHYPDVPIRGDVNGTRGFFDCDKAATMLGWTHDAG